MGVDFEHPLVGRAVVYRAGYPEAKPEDGEVTSVNREADIVFVRYRTSNTPQATSPRDLTTLSGTPVAALMDPTARRTSP